MQVSGIELLIALYKFVILLFSLSVHECAQAWMALRLGDQTARIDGRISLNPMRHIDIVGSLIYPALMIFAPLMGIPWFGNGTIVMGWGKPVPVTTRNLKNITRDYNLIALAGPAAYLVLVAAAFAFIVVLILAVPGGRDAVGTTLSGQVILDGTSVPQALALLGLLTIEVNLALFFFNLLPIPPLDASRVVRNLLPYNALHTFDTIGRYGFIAIFILGQILVSLFMGPAMRLIIGLLARFFPVG